MKFMKLIDKINDAANNYNKTKTKSCATQSNLPKKEEKNVDQETRF